MRKVVVSVSLIFLFNACSHPSEILADCFHNFNLSAWNDLDENGKWDLSEPPLEGVEFHIDGRFALVLSKYPCFSHEDGRCTFQTWEPGFCDKAEYKITAVIPEFFEATTPHTITVALETTDTSQEL